MYKKLLATLLAFGLIAGTLAGCGDSGGGAAAGKNSSTDGQANGGRTITAKELHVVVDGNVINFAEGMTENDNFIFNGLKEKAGIDLKWTILPNVESVQKLNSMMSAGDAGDIISMRDSSRWDAMQRKSSLSRWTNTCPPPCI